MRNIMTRGTTGIARNAGISGRPKPIDPMTKAERHQGQASNVNGLLGTGRRPSGALT